MPKVRRQNLPGPLLTHLLMRMRQRNISWEQIVLLSYGLDQEPDVPEGKWFKRFPAFIVCGEGELVKTLLTEGQIPSGKDLG